MSKASKILQACDQFILLIKNAEISQSNFNQQGDKRKINPAYQVIINRLLKEYGLGGGHQLKIDGVWGPQTQAALDAVREKLNQVYYKKGRKLKPFVTEADLDQLNSWGEWVNNKLY